MRILQAIAGAATGGAERFFERLVPALGRAGVEQRVLLRPHPARVSLLRAAGVADLHALSFGGRFDLLSRRRFARQVADFAPDIVFTWMSRASARAPHRTDGRARPLHVARLGGYYDLKYYGGCDYLIGDTQDIVTYLVGKGWPAERAVYLPNFADETPGRALAPASLGVPESAPILLALGRLHPNKAFDVLVRALALVPEAHLLLAGNGPQQAALEALATELGVASRVHVLGWRDDVADLFATAHLFVHPARHEPLGNVVIEAWAHRLPAVCAASQGPAALIEDGATGRLVPVDDAPALAAAIREVLATPAAARAMADAGRRRFESDFNETAVVGKYMAFFERILA